MTRIGSFLPEHWGYKDVILYVLHSYGILRGTGSKPRHGMKIFFPSNDASTGFSRKRTCKIGYLAYLLPLFTNYVDFMHDRCVFFQLHVGFSRVTCER
jgi:hypothetical protein